MAFTSALPLYSGPKVILNKQRLGFEPLVLNETRWLGPDNACFVTRRCRSWSNRLVVTAANVAEGGVGRRMYRQSQSQQSPLSSAPVKQIATFVVPAGVFVAATFVLWKVVEKLLMPKPSSFSSIENESPSLGVKWSFAPGTNLSSAKIDRQSKLMLDELARQLRALHIVDMSGLGFGDDGLVVLAKSLAYNEKLEEVSFTVNGITATGIKEFNDFLLANIVLKTLNLSGNPIGDEGVKKNETRIKQ